MKSLNEQQMQLHVPVVAWLLIVYNSILLLVALGIFTLMMGAAAFVHESQARQILPVVGAFVPFLMASLTIPDFIAAFGLLARKRWARILGIVVGIFNLFAFPIGTIIGSYTIFVLMQDAAANYFASPSARLQTSPRPA